MDPHYSRTGSLSPPQSTYSTLAQSEFGPLFCVFLALFHNPLVFTIQVLQLYYITLFAIGSTWLNSPHLLPSLRTTKHETPSGPTLAANILSKSLLEPASVHNVNEGQQKFSDR